MTAFQLRRPYGAMQGRALQTAGYWGAGGARDPERERARVRLWLPLTALFVILAPFALLLALIAYAPGRFFGVNAFALALRLGAVLMSIGGTLVEVEAADVSVRFKIV